MEHAKKWFVKALAERGAEGRDVTDVFAVTKKTLLTSSRDKPYLRLTLTDRTGSIEGFVWEQADRYATAFDVGDLLEVTGRVQMRNDTAQLRVDHLTRVPDREAETLDKGDFLPGLDGETRRRLWAEIEGVLDGVAHADLRRLLREFLDDAEFRAAFEEAPAARGFHHAYVGGLVEHTRGVLRLAQAVLQVHRDRLDPDLLLAGAFFHDVGKVREIACKPGFGYTDEGALVGHIVVGVQMLHERAARLPGFPPRLLLQLEHLVLSHHGEKQWGAPVEPQTLEAIALHYLDNLDAKLAGALEWLDRESVPPGSWSSFWKGLGRPLLRTGGGSGPAAEPDAAAWEETFRKAAEQTDGPAPEDADARRRSGNQGELF